MNKRIQITGGVAALLCAVAAATPLVAARLRPASAQTPPVAQMVPAAEPVKQTGTSIVASDWRTALLSDWKTPTTFGGLETTPDGLALVTRDQPEHLYSLQTQLHNQVALKKGDTLLIRFAARSRKPDKNTGVTKLRVGFSKASPDWDASYGGEIGVGTAWQRFDIPFTCKNDFGPREARMTFLFGYPAQEAEVADVQVLRFAPGVLPSSLPKTKRYADTMSPDALKSEVARVVALRNALASVKDPAPARGAVLHVAKTGSPTGDGSAKKPFATIPQALALAKPGDTVLVGAGEYHEPNGVSVKKSGLPDAWIKIKAAPGGARPKIVTSGWSGIELRGGVCYVEIDGFEWEWVKGDAPPAPGAATVHGSGIATMYATHHIRVLNNVVHGYGTGGIISLDCDYLHIEGNVIYDTAKTSPYGGSAISLCRAFNHDDNSGYHNVVRRNVCYDNELRVSVLATSGGNNKALTDGNGIIIDVFKRSRANPLKPHNEDRDGPLLPYRGRTLIENNLIYNNGGRGIHVFRSEKVDVINNTCYQNQKTPDINAGEYTAIEAGEVAFFNNIAYGRAEKRGNTQDGSTKIVWSHNLFFNADDVLLHAGVMGKDPQFAAPALTAPPTGFLLRPGSPARGQGLAQVAPPDDLSGKARAASGRVDLGAFQSEKK